MPEQKTISILGSSGSIGMQSLEVISSISGNYSLGFLTVNKNIDLLAQQIEKFNPYGVAIKDEKAYTEFKHKSSFKGKILCGEEGLCEAASYPECDIVISSLVGFSGVNPTLAAIRAGKTIALANKETLVSAGSIITNEARRHSATIIPVDSEHNAVLQCLIGEERKSVEKIILTASGGPFLKTSIEEFVNLTVSDALDHPNWSMGNKVTIDSATMMNKGFEIIEACWLFDYPSDKIDVLIHPQSIVHSMVQFIDGSVKAQLGPPDMRLPIAYALSYPGRFELSFPKLDLTQIVNLSFYHPDQSRFPCLSLAYEALKTGGTATSALNAANEIAVEAFLNERISFTKIPELIADSMAKAPYKSEPSLEDIIECDSATRKICENYIKSPVN
ncbi:MAG: dxr [Ignavibacteria bacterium]|nr:dxr [Ignavibacteria bacterium]